MINIHKRNQSIEKLLEDNYISTKINIYFSTKIIDEGYDDYEKNYTRTNLNPVIIKGYVRELNPTKLIYKNYGLSEQGAVECIMSSKYENWMRECNKVEINNKKYQVFRESVGNRVLITVLPFQLIKVVLRKNE